MRAFFITLILTLGTICGYAQGDLVFQLNKEGKLMVIPKYVTYELHIPPLSYNTYTPASTFKLDMNLPGFNAETSMQLDERPMDMQILSAAYRPFFNVFTPMLMGISPMALDFSETYFKPTSEHFTFMINGTQLTWPGSGKLISVTPMMVWHNEQWTLRASGFAARYVTPFDQSPGIVGGVTGSASYQATDWLKVNVWGQYAAYDQSGRENPFLYMHPYQYHTNFGGSMEFKVTDKVGFGIGLQHNYNPVVSRWDRQFMVYPVYYKGSRIGISAF